MTELVGSALVGFLAGRLAWVLLRPTLEASPTLARVNWRERPVVTAAGIVVPIAAVLVEAGRAVAAAVETGEGGELTAERALVLVAALGFGLLGLLDDVVGGEEAGGFRGHVGALARGRLTAGGMKLVAGAALAVAMVSPVSGDSFGRLVVDAALVALSANLANLLDRRPGRAIKASTLAFVVLAVLGGAGALRGGAVVVGAALALFLDDLHEHLMLGDAGANVLGGVIGLGVVLTCAPGTRVGVLVVVAAVNVLSEIASFTKLIEAIGPLRYFDELGRRR